MQGLLYGQLIVMRTIVCTCCMGLEQDSLLLLTGALTANAWRGL
jgi:hypothetical protein